MLVYTSITKSYLPKARVLAKSIKQFHPDWTFVLLFSDVLPVDFNLASESFDEVLNIENLGIPNWKSWAFRHAVVELCTAVKGPAAQLLAQRPGVDKIMYIDPDIKVFASLAFLDKMLDHDDILLTPHLLAPESDIDAIRDNEISALKHGVYNLGFFAAKTSGQGLDFIKWWAERLTLFCRNDIANGLFTDQRWCDLAPAFFSKLGIVRDNGCNVATWNIAHRPLSKNENGKFLVAGVPLRFYHFTSYDNGNGFSMLEKYASNQEIAHELWDAYGKELKQEGHGNSINNDWFYGQFENGTPIPLACRKLYLIRQDLQSAFPNPYSVVEPCFFSWWKNEGFEENGVMINGATLPPKRLFKKIVQGICSPTEGVRILKLALRLVKKEGISGLIRRVCNY